MSASEDKPDDATSPNVDPRHAGQRGEGSVDDPFDALSADSPYSGNVLALGETGAGKTTLHSTVLPQITTQVFLPNSDARDDAHYAALRLTDAEFRRLRTPRSA